MKSLQASLRSTTLPQRPRMAAGAGRGHWGRSGWLLPWLRACSGVRCRCCRSRCGCRRRWPAGRTLCLPCPRPLRAAPVPRPLPGRACAFWQLPGVRCAGLWGRDPGHALLQKAARVLCSEEYRTALRQQLAAGAATAAARQAAVQAAVSGVGHCRLAGQAQQ